MWVVRLGFIILLVCVCVCVCVHVCVHARDESVFFICVRERWIEEETLGVRGAVVCACHIACTYCTVYGCRPRVCVPSRSLGRLAWTRWEEMRGERRGLGRRSEAHLMPVCIDSVWHLSARDTHPVWRAEILWHCVCECVCVEVTVPVAKLTAYELIFFFSFSFCTLVPLDTRPVFLRSRLPNSEASSSPPLSLSPSVLPSFPSSYPLSHHHYVCDLCPYEGLDAFPGCSNQVIGSRTWIPLHARRFSRQNDFYLPIKLLRK